MTVESTLLFDEASQGAVEILSDQDTIYRARGRRFSAAPMAENYLEADFITICDELERSNKLEEVGGASYITSLINQVPTSGNVA